MNLNKFIQKNIFKKLIALYALSVFLFLILRVFDFYRESNRFYSLTKNYIKSSTEQLLNEGEVLRLQMNIDQFLGLNNMENDQIICPKVYLDEKLVASSECHGFWIYSKAEKFKLNNDQDLKFHFQIDGTHFLVINVGLIFVFSILLILIFVFFKKSIDEFSHKVTLPLLKWSEWAKQINFKEKFEIPVFTKEELEITEFDNFNKFNQRAFELQSEFYQSKLVEEKARIEIELAKSVSHDIRSPLLALKNIQSDIVFNNVESESVFMSMVNRIELIANNLLIKVSHENKVQSFFVQLKNLIYEKKFLYKNIELTIENDILEDQTFFLKDNEQKILRIVSNLINNGIEAQESNIQKYIYFKAWVDVGYLKIEIKDNGAGIPKSFRDKIGKTSITSKEMSSHSGSGIGLLNAYRFIQEIDGKIDFLSDSDGTRFFIEIPLVPSQIVLIDDDRIVHFVWKKEARSKGIDLVSYFNSKDSLLEINKFQKNIPIFIDKNIGNDNGEELVLELYRLGFTQLYIQTGETEVERIEYVKDVLSKKFPYCN